MCSSARLLAAPVITVRLEQKNPFAAPPAWWARGALPCPSPPHTGQGVRGEGGHSRVWAAGSQGRPAPAEYCGIWSAHVKSGVLAFICLPGAPPWSPSVCRSRWRSRGTTRAVSRCAGTRLVLECSQLPVPLPSVRGLCGRRAGAEPVTGFGSRRAMGRAVQRNPGNGGHGRSRPGCCERTPGGARRDLSGAVSPNGSALLIRVP